jgi:hypothetical protein
MKITRRQLRRIIKEEMSHMSRPPEDMPAGYSYGSPADEAYAEGYDDAMNGRGYDDSKYSSNREYYEMGYEHGLEDMG